MGHRYSYGDYPALLFVLAGDRQAKTFLEYAQSVFESTGIDDVNVIVTAFDELILFDSSSVIARYLNRSQLS